MNYLYVFQSHSAEYSNIAVAAKNAAEARQEIIENWYKYYFESGYTMIVVKNLSGITLRQTP